MKGNIFYLAGNTAAIRYAAQLLASRGVNMVSSPGPDVTHLLLPVPSFEADGRVKGAGNLWHILGDLPKEITVIGGDLEHPALEGYRTIDLLQDLTYLAKNAAITAHCAVRIAAQRLNVVFQDCPMLVIGWGRIGKCLAQQLKAAGADVTVAARKESDRAMLEALGFGTEIPDKIGCSRKDYRVVFNTAPASILDDTRNGLLRPDCVKIDLASQPGISGKDVIWARGLPGKDAPESSGQLIAQTVLRLVGKEEGK